MKDTLNAIRGKTLGLVGESGCGKTTTSKLILNLEVPTDGRVLLEGKPIHGRPPHEIVRLGIAQSPEGRGIFANLTVDENLAMGSFARRDRAEAARDRERALDLFPRVRERLKQNAGTLSGGEQQMLAMARALMARPRLLLLDEPSLGLAPQIVQTIFKIIRDINAEGTTILLVEQNAHMALNVAHYGYCLEVGRVCMCDSGKALAASDEVRKAYLGGH